MVTPLIVPTDETTSTQLKSFANNEELGILEGPREKRTEGLGGGEGLGCRSHTPESVPTWSSRVLRVRTLATRVATYRNNSVITITHLDDCRGLLRMTCKQCFAGVELLEPTFQCHRSKASSALKLATHMLSFGIDRFCLGEELIGFGFNLLPHELVPGSCLGLLHDQSEVGRTSGNTLHDSIGDVGDDVFADRREDLLVRFSLLFHDLDS